MAFIRHVWSRFGWFIVALVIIFALSFAFDRITLILQLSDGYYSVWRL